LDGGDDEFRLLRDSRSSSLARVDVIFSFVSSKSATCVDKDDLVAALIGALTRSATISPSGRRIPDVVDIAPSSMVQVKNSVGHQ
jgi:hypothetical protein